MSIALSYIMAFHRMYVLYVVVIEMFSYIILVHNFLPDFIREFFNKYSEILNFFYGKKIAQKFVLLYSPLENNLTVEKVTQSKFSNFQG